MKGYFCWPQALNETNIMAGKDKKVSTQKVTKNKNKSSILSPPETLSCTPGEPIFEEKHQ